MSKQDYRYKKIYQDDKSIIFYEKHQVGNVDYRFVRKVYQVNEHGSIDGVRPVDQAIDEATYNNANVSELTGKIA